MNNESRPPNDQTFGEQLLGMQGFSAARAERYRAEMENLVAHRISKLGRWTMALGAIVLGGLLVVMGAEIATSPQRPDTVQLGEARWTVAITCVLTGVMLGGWLLNIAIRGGYELRLGDVMGVLILMVFGGGWGLSLIWVALETSDVALRGKLLLGGGGILVSMTGCLLGSILQRMHRMTQTKLLRIEYYLAQLIEAQYDQT